MPRREQPADLQLGPIAPGSNLVAALSAMLEGELLAGRLNVGDRLPPTSELCAATGVSRTVVREAVAQLRASGLIETRRGAGAFVVAVSKQLFMSNSIRQGILDDILAVLELRLAVEVEAAAMAAQRRTESDIEKLKITATAMESSGPGNTEFVVADLAFHQAIAGATKNKYLVEFIEHLGRQAFPRQHIGLREVECCRLDEQFYRICQEHRSIFVAIRDGNGVLAAAEMRTHLAGSRSRYQVLVGGMPA